jgi:glutaredoxin 3
MLDLSIIQLKGLVKRMTGVAGYRANPDWTAQHEMALLDLIKMELAAKILAGEEAPVPHFTAEIFGTSTCPYCDQAKELLDKHNIPHVFKNIDEDEEAFDQLVGRIKSWKTVPQIFLGPDHIGGYDCLHNRLEPEKPHEDVS